MNDLNVYNAVSTNDIVLLKRKINSDNVNDVIDNENWTVLHLTCSYNNRLEMVKYLLSIGADFNLKTKRNNTPLDIAKEYNNIEIKEFLQLYIRFNKK